MPWLRRACRLEEPARTATGSTAAEQVLDPMTAYQITSMMEYVVQAGTATVVKESPASRSPGKTGTTNDEKGRLVSSAFSPDLVVGIYVGYDKAAQPRQGRHRRSSGSSHRQGLPETRARRQGRRSRSRCRPGQLSSFASMPRGGMPRWSGAEGGPHHSGSLQAGHRAAG